MAVRLDEARRTLVAGGVEWPFRLDLQRGTATVETPGGERRVRPQRWAEKRRLAQFAGWGEEFFREQVWNMCVRPGGAPASEDERDAILQLAVWLTCGGRIEESLPYDRRLLDNATFDSCRALGVAPNQLDSLPAYEVEALWRCSQQNEPGGLPSAPQAHQEFSHQILIVPDAPAGVADPVAPAAGATTAHDVLTSAPRPEPGASEPPPEIQVAAPKRKAGFVQARTATATEQVRVQAPMPRRSAEPAPRAEAAPTEPRQTISPRPVSRPIPNDPETPSSPEGKPARRTLGLSTFRVVMGRPAALLSGAAASGRPEFAEPSHADPMVHEFPGIGAESKPDYFFLTPERQTVDGRAPAAMRPAVRIAAGDMPEPSSVAVPAQPAGVAFDTFADEFADRLQAAAGEMGILEDL
jgi:hypothetical protein